MRLLRSFNLLMCIVITNRGIVYTSFGLDQGNFFFFFSFCSGNTILCVWKHDITVTWDLFWHVLF